ncbi:hypothetical protein GW17_00024900, partial [Ensete ventricosum]
GESQVLGLAVVIVGVRKDSQSYVSMKRKACVEVGIQSIDVDFPEQISELDVVAKVHELNDDPARTCERKAVAASRGSSKKAEGEDSGCGWRGLWLRLRLLKMKQRRQAGAARSKGATGRKMRQQGWQGWLDSAGGSRNTGGSGDKATAEGCGSGDAAVRQWAAAADLGWSRGSSGSGEEWQVTANRWGTTSATGAGSGLAGGDIGRGWDVDG